MKTIQFLVACLVRDARLGTPEEERYEAGQVVTLSDPSAERWVRRGYAVLTEPPREASVVPVQAESVSDPVVTDDPRPLRRGKVRKDTEA